MQELPQTNAPGQDDSPAAAGDSIHGHEVMRMIVAGQGRLTPAALADQVRARFGDQARFHTCSINNATLDELLEFLKGRGKTVLQDGTLHTSAGQICNHE